MAYNLRWTPLSATQPQPQPTGTGGAPTYREASFNDNALPGAGTSLGTDPSFDQNVLPGQGQSFTGAGSTPNAYTNPNSNPFDQPRLNGSMGSPPPFTKRGSGYLPPPPGAGGGDESPLAGPGYREDWYKKYGQDLMGDPTASERLFDMGVAGSNPYYDFAQQQAIKAINDSAAARGGFNSSYTQNLIGKTVADIRGQQAHELNMLAGQADTGKFGRYDRGERYAGNAQDAMENRANRGLDYAYKLASGKANLVPGFYGEAGRESFQAQMAAIEAALKKAGLTSAEAQQMLNQFGQGVGIFTSLYGMGGKTGGNAPQGGYGGYSVMGNGMGGDWNVAPSGG